MNKKKYIILGIILGILILSITTILIIDASRFLKHTKPLIVFKVKHYDLTDGYVNQYISLGYEFLEFDTSTKKGWEFNIGFTKNFEEDKGYRIVYDGEIYENCSEHSTLIYNDEYNYYLECVDADKMTVYYEGNEYTITDALEKGIITIHNIAESGYRVVVE